jgi:hypothetical protein
MRLTMITAQVTSSRGTAVSEPISVQATFVLLYAETMLGRSNDEATTVSGLEAIDPDHAAADRISRIQHTERRLLGDRYQQAQRVSRRSVGRLPLGDRMDGEVVADVYRVTHLSGAAAWEVWLTSPEEPLRVQAWIDRLSLTLDDSLAAWLWRALNGSSDDPADRSLEAPEIYLPLGILRAPGRDLPAVLAEAGTDLVRLVHLDASKEAFKPGFVAHELAQDFCLREGGLSLLSPRAALDLHCGLAYEEQAALPLLISLELLALERATLRRFYEQLTGERTKRLDELLQLKRDVADGLEEYYGSLAIGNAFSAQTMALGQSLLGIDDLYRSVISRLDMVTFGITTRLERQSSQVSLWLAVVFGAIGNGFLAASIASWYYAEASALGVVLAWTVGTTLITAILIAGLLRVVTRE